MFGWNTKKTEDRYLFTYMIYKSSNHISSVYFSVVLVIMRFTGKLIVFFAFRTVY